MRAVMGPPVEREVTITMTVSEAMLIRRMLAMSRLFVVDDKIATACGRLYAALPEVML